MYLLKRPLVAQRDARVRVRRLVGRRRRARRQLLKILARQANQRLVREIAGRRYDHVGGRVDGGIIIAHGGLIELADGLGRAQDRLAQRMVFPEVGREDLLHQVIGAIGLHLDLFQNDALFFLDVFVAKQRMQHQIGQHVEGARQVLVEDLGVEAHQLLAGEGVQVAADRIHRARDSLRRAAGGALEQHVLDEVRDAVALRDFAPRAGAYPDAHRNRPHMRHALADDAQPVRERGHFDIPDRIRRGGHFGEELLYILCSIVRGRTVTSNRNRQQGGAGQSEPRTLSGGPLRPP